MSNDRPGTRKKGRSKAENSGITSTREYWAKILRQGGAILWGLCAFLVVFGVIFVSQMPTQIGLRAGEVSDVDVKAPQEVIDVAATERLKTERAANTPKVWETDPKVLADLKSMIQSLFDSASSVVNSAMSTQQVLSLLRPYAEEDLPDTVVMAVAAASHTTLETASSQMRSLVDSVLSAGLKQENLASAKDAISDALTSDKEIPLELGQYLASVIRKSLKANHLFNQEETERRIKEAVASVEPVRIRRGQFIVREGDIVTEDQIEILQDLGMMGGGVRYTALAGSFVIALMIAFFLGYYLHIYQADVVSSGKLPLVATTMILGVLAVKLFSGLSGLLAPTAAGVMLAATLIERRLGIIYAVCITFVTGAVTGFEIKYMVLSLVGGLAASLVLRADWNRTEIVKSGLVVAGINAMMYVCMGLTGAIPMSDATSPRDLLFVAGNGIVSAVLALGSLPLLELLFGIITPVRLLEISNPDHPLLRRLLLEAPGTYHHSIMVGNLSEAAAVAIGADSLLARVGAYFHDIGKLKRPYFFAENQSFGADNPHDKMSPSLSATVVTSHVRDGLELAEEHKVPAIVRQFIGEHHGTTLAAYFYAKASESETRDGRGPEEIDFRYEGPRPGSKETAIVMLADSIEAAVRSISKPTPARIESMVRKIIQERLQDGQLDRSDLTLKELDTIANTFTKVLAGIFHSRIEYPDKVTPKPADGDEGVQG